VSTSKLNSTCAVWSLTGSRSTGTVRSYTEPHRGAVQRQHLVLATVGGRAKHRFGLETRRQRRLSREAANPTDPNRTCCRAVVSTAYSDALYPSSALYVACRHRMLNMACVHANTIGGFNTGPKSRPLGA
jgi:hypothetical protein